MPNVPHPITVTVYNTDGVTLLSGAQISVINSTKGTTHTSSQTTNSQGIGIIDLANLSTGYSDGDVIIIVARNGYPYYNTASYTVSGNEYEVTLTLTGVPDPLQTVLDILEDNWNAGRTDLITPQFNKITDLKKIDYNYNTDWVLAQRSRKEMKPAGIGPANKHEKEMFELDIRAFGRDREQHWLNTIEEIKRILQLKKILPTSQFEVLEFDETGTDLSDKMHDIWRIVMPVQLYRYNVSR